MRDKAVALARLLYPCRWRALVGYSCIWRSTHPLIQVITCTLQVAAAIDPSTLQAVYKVSQVDVMEAVLAHHEVQAARAQLEDDKVDDEGYDEITSPTQFTPLT